MLHIHPNLESSKPLSDELRRWALLLGVTAIIARKRIGRSEFAGFVQQYLSIAKRLEAPMIDDVPHVGKCKG